MKLDPDCVRDILLVVEDKSAWGRPVQFPNDWPDESLERFSIDVIRYHIQQCFDNGLLSQYSNSRSPWDLAGNAVIRDLSPAGHEALANFRSEKIWNFTKEKAKKLGVSSLNALLDIAAKVATAIVANAFIS